MPTFDLGRILATPGALKAMEESGQAPVDFLKRHFNCDWGDMDDEDRQSNDAALDDGSRLFSAYHTSTGTKLWVITEADSDEGGRLATTILLPEEY